MVTSQRIVLHTTCLDYIRTKSDAFKKIETYGVDCKHGEEPNNLALKGRECAAVILIIDDLAMTVLDKVIKIKYCDSFCLRRYEDR